MGDDDVDDDDYDDGGGCGALFRPQAIRCARIACCWKKLPPLGRALIQLHCRAL